MWVWICCALAQPWWLWLQFCHLSSVCVCVCQNHWAAWINRLQAWETHGYVWALLCYLNGSSLFPPLLLGGSESAISDVSHYCHSHLVFINIKAWFWFIISLILNFTFWLIYSYCYSLTSAAGSLHLFLLLSLVLGSWGGEAAAGEMADGTRAPPAGTTKPHILS